MRTRASWPLALLLLVTIAGDLPAQRTLADVEALQWSGVQRSGMGGIPAQIRERIRRDHDALQLCADLLEGRRRVDVRWDTATVLWWLAESDEARFIPIFLRFADTTMSPPDYQHAAYGLARHAGDEGAERALLAIGRHRPIRYRLLAAWALMVVNDDRARAILRQVRLEGIRPEQPDLIERVLAAPALPRGVGRGPRGPGRVFAAGPPTGAFRCLRAG